MSKKMFVKLAFENIKKNARLYVPQMIITVVMTAALYILTAITVDDRITGSGASVLPIALKFANPVYIGISVVVVLYTNSFLMKQRKSEYGLYNVLGLGKKHITFIMFLEMAFSASVSILCGGVLGIILYKLATLFLSYVLRVNTVYSEMKIFWGMLIVSMLVFAGVYVFTFICNVISILRLKPLQLVESKKKGEREPKVKALLLIEGLITLGAGYYIALTTKHSITAVSLFFFAVVLVIVGTYSLFTAGTIFILKMLKKNTNFYYNKKHMTAVSGLLYRMKQNAVGLASICILSTMVIIMVSVSSSLFAQVDSVLEEQMPNDMEASITYGDLSEEKSIEVRKIIEEVVEDEAKKQGVEITSMQERNAYVIAALYREGVIYSDLMNYNALKDNSPIQLFCITDREYERLTGKKCKVADNEAILYSLKTNNIKYDDEIAFSDFNLKIEKNIEDYPISMEAYKFFDCFGIIVSQKTMDDLEAFQSKSADEATNEMEHIHDVVFNFKGSESQKLKLSQAVEKRVNKIVNKKAKAYAKENNPKGHKNEISRRGMVSYKAGLRESLYDTYGSLMFIAVVLGMIFLMVTVIIIYYKQISEGYEDRGRFQIMQKVGMSEREVKDSIKTQVLIVFFLPVAVAAVHVLVAYPLIESLLMMIGLADKAITRCYTVGTYGIFFVVYVVIYLCTSKVYYKLVR
ncbi:MAG: ABC transporter permease [Lachnospiraceae bacterium]|nr:ABC transporter permease [Lachnospiraceae bacterium]